MNLNDYLLNKHLLLVDDEQELLDMVVSILNEYGFYNITTAKSIKDAVEATQKLRPELAILDVMLPDGNGFELMKQIKQYSDCPILFLTACGEDEDKFKGFDLGADDYIVKPF
ncbi:DNA-binding response regulator, partial [Gardnerella vaginalis]